MKKAHTYTRRGRALRLVGILLVILLLCHVTGAYYFLPVQALHRLLATQAAGDTEVVSVLYDPDLTPTPLMRYYLCANDQVLLLAGTRFHPLMGWYEEFAPAVPLNGPEPVKVCYQTFSRKGQEQKMYIFGLVDDPGVTAVELEGRYWYDDIAGTRSVRILLTEEDWITHQGKRYFLKEASSLIRPEPEGCYDGIYVSALDAGGAAIPHMDRRGETVTAYRVEHYSSTSFG